jgi:hypothetical protein
MLEAHLLKPKVGQFLKGKENVTRKLVALEHRNPLAKRPGHEMLCSIWAMFTLLERQGLALGATLYVLRLEMLNHITAVAGVVSDLLSTPYRLELTAPWQIYTACITSASAALNIHFPVVFSDGASMSTEPTLLTHFFHARS